MSQALLAWSSLQPLSKIILKCASHLFNKKIKKIIKKQVRRMKKSLTKKVRTVMPELLWCVILLALAVVLG